MMIKRIIPLLFLSSVHATEYVNVNIGHFGIQDDIEHPTRYGIEYRGNPLSSLKLIPSIGYVWSDSSAKYLYVEGRHDFHMSSNWLLTPSFGLGSFANGHPHDINLGNSLEFRSGIELGYQFKNKMRTGVAVYHLSNGGTSSTNPGTESLVFSFHFPVDF